MPKESFSKEAVLEAAWEIVRHRGIEAVSVRTVAARLHSSPGPIYRHFGTIQNLMNAVLERAQRLLVSWMLEPYTEFSFLNMGIGFIRFARDEAKLFQGTMLTPRYSRGFIRSTNVICMSLMEKMEQFSQFSNENRKKILETMSIVSYGLAVQIFLGILPQPSDEEIIQRLNLIGTGTLHYYKTLMPRHTD